MQKHTGVAEKAQEEISKTEFLHVHRSIQFGPKGPEVLVLHYWCVH